MRVLHIASEVTPFVKTGGLADVVGELPISLAKNGVESIVILPLYQSIKPFYREQFQFIKHFDVYLGIGKKYAGIFKYERNGVTYYFIDNESYFGRNGIYGYDDEGERYGFFQMAAIELIGHLQLRPDIVHCHDWQTGMVSVLYYEKYQYYPFYENIRFIFTVHNPAYQGNYSLDILDKIFGISKETYFYGKTRFNDNVSYLKSALIYSDYVTTVSKSYKNELCSLEGGYGLESIFSYRYEDLFGIVNGIDYDSYNPDDDLQLVYHFNKDNIENKVKNKTLLQKRYELEVNEDIPLFSCITRLTWQKGVELILDNAERLINEHNAQLFIIGSGDYHYERRLQELRDRFPKNVAIYIGYNGELARKVYAASDMFLMPSLFEPCGISQLISLRYGTIPIVREVGGLKDTVVPYNEYTSKGTGFSFTKFDNNDFYHIINYALSFYKQKDRWNDLVKQAMNANWSWDKQCSEYIDLYKKLINKFE